MKKLILLPILIFSYCLNSNSQTTAETYNFAEIQFADKNYDCALKEYQRALFFDTTSNKQLYVKRIAEIFSISGNVSMSNIYYDIAYAITDSLTDRLQLVLDKSKMLILNHQFKFALQELLSLDTLYSKKQDFERNLYTAICYYGLEDFSTAYFYFNRCIDSENNDSKTKLYKMFKKNSNFYYPNPKAANIMSMAIPGMGQIYCGDFKNGLNSFVLVTGLAFIGIDIALKYRPFDAFLAIFPWFQRYHQGGFTHAKDIAIEKRDIRRSKSFNKILFIIDNQK